MNVFEASTVSWHEPCNRLSAREESKVARNSPFSPDDEEIIMALEFNKDNFQDEVLGSDQPVLVDFWAPWCGPCVQLGPTIDELATDFDGKAKVGKVNVDDNQELAARFNIRGIPTVILFKGGEPVQNFVGIKPKTEFAEAIDANL